MHLTWLLLEGLLSAHSVLVCKLHSAAGSKQCVVQQSKQPVSAVHGGVFLGNSNPVDLCALQELERVGAVVAELTSATITLKFPESRTSQAVSGSSVRRESLLAQLPHQLKLL